MTLVLLPTALDPPEREDWPARPALAVWMVVALIAVEFFIARLLEWSHYFHWSLLSERLFLIFTYTTASWSLYSDPALFAPWQLWTSCLVHDSWWFVILNLLVLMVVGRPLERWLGGGAFAFALLTLAPMAALIHLLAEPHGTIVVGANGLVVGLLGLAWALFPRTHVRWGLAYYAVITVGYVPLFRLPLAWFAALYLVADGLACANGAAAATMLVDGGTLITGLALGLAGRRLRQPAAN